MLRDNFSHQEDAMNHLKEQLARWIDEDREKIIGFPAIPATHLVASLFILTKHSMGG